MKNLLMLILLVFTSFNLNAVNTEKELSHSNELLSTTEIVAESPFLYLSCFEAARQIVIGIYGEINISNVHHVNNLTAICEDAQQ